MIYIAFVSRGHGIGTPGKRTPYLSSLGRQVKEFEFNDPTADRLIEKLKRCGVLVFNVSSPDDDVPLKERTDYANKIYWQHVSKYGKENVKAVYLSIHYNALDGSFEGKNPSGFSVHIYEGQKTKEAGKLAAAILKELEKGTKQINRGIVEQDLHETRETEMEAALMECGFMDHPEEALLMLDPKFHEEVATEVATGTCVYFGIPYVPEVVKVEPAKKPDYIGHSFEKSIKKAIESGVIKGYDEYTFKPDEPVTRGQLAAILDRAGLCEKKGVETK